MRIIFLGAVLSASCISGIAHAQEKADAIYRDLQYAGFYDEHAAMLWEYAAGNPDDENNHLILEMLGNPQNGIFANTVQNFKHAASYRGAWTTHPTKPDYYKRRDIAETMNDLRRAGVKYVGSWYDAITKYLERDGTGSLQLEQIRRMRCEAVVEYAYAANGFPILRLGPSSGTIISDPDAFIAAAAARDIYPSTQRAAMDPSMVAVPVITIFNSDGQIIPDGGVSNTPSISVNVADIDSGPGRIELWRGEVDTGQLIASNTGFDGADYYIGTDRTFTNGDAGLFAFNNLPDGQYTIRGVDQSGNSFTKAFYVSVPFRLKTIVGTQSGNTVYSVHWDTAAAAYIADIDNKFNARADIDIRLDFSKPVSTYTFTAALMDGATTAFSVSKVGPPPSDSPKTWRGVIKAGALSAAPGPKPSYALVISTGAEPGQTMFSEPVKFAVRPAIADSVYMLDGSSLCWHAPMSIASATVVAGALDPNVVSSMTIIITLASDATSTAELLEPSVTVPAGTHYELYSNLPVSYEVRMYNMKPGEYGISAVSSDTETVSMFA